MKLFRRSRADEQSSAGPTSNQRRGRKASDDGTTVFAFKAYTSEAAAFAVASTVISFTAEDMEARIRKEARLPKAHVVVVEPRDWDAPRISSLGQQDVVAAFPLVVKSASNVLSRAFAVGPLGQSEMIDRGAGAMPHPSGHVLFLFAVTGHYEWAEDGGAGEGAS